MAEFKEELVINALHPEKAEVGKKYWFADELSSLKSQVEENNTGYTLTEILENDITPFKKSIEECGAIWTLWKFLYPYEEPPNKRMTNRQLAEWLAKGNGVFKYKNATAYCYSFITPLENNLNEEVEENVVICYWGSEEWQVPTVDIYERDCKGGKNES